MEPAATGNVQLSVTLTFKQLRDQFTKFSGDGKEYFEVWLVDYCEATGWTNQLRVTGSWLGQQPHQAAYTM